MVRDVSEDPVYHTIEFNEFLQLLSKQQRSGTNYDSLKDAFSIFDKDDDGYIPVNEMRDILQSLGDKMTDQELDEMMAAADSDQDGFINYEGKHSVRHKGTKILFNCTGCLRRSISNQSQFLFLRPSKISTSDF